MTPSPLSSCWLPPCRPTPSSPPPPDSPPLFPPWLQAFHPPQTICAYDADLAGDLAADSIRLHTPHFSRLRPVGAKDWNDLLRRAPSP